MAGSCPPTAPTGPPQGAPLSPMLPAHRTRRKPPGSSGPPAAGGAQAGQPQATQAQDDTRLPVPETCARLSSQVKISVPVPLASGSWVKSACSTRWAGLGGLRGFGVDIADVCGALLEPPAA